MRTTAILVQLLVIGTMACGAGTTNPPAPPPPPAPGPGQPPVPPPPPPPPAQPPPTGNATIQDLGLIPSALLGNSRRVRVYLPPGYDTGADRYPVLYLHDGQQIFGSTTAFYLDRALTPLILSGAVRPLLVVAIDNRGDATRVMDYTMAPPNVGALYARMVAEELKPRIDASFRTWPGPATTGVGGVSLGAGLSWYMGLTHSNVFGIVIAQSGVTKAMGGFPNYIATVQNFPGKPPLRIWYDRGTADGEAFHQVSEQEMRAALIAKGMVEGQDFRYLLVPGALHTWGYWAQRIDPFMRFLFPPVSAAPGQ